MFGGSGEVEASTPTLREVGVEDKGLKIRCHQSKSRTLGREAYSRVTNLAADGQNPTSKSMHAESWPMGDPLSGWGFSTRAAVTRCQNRQAGENEWVSTSTFLALELVERSRKGADSLARSDWGFQRNTALAVKMVIY